jgi:hypothetical protein
MLEAMMGRRSRGVGGYDGLMSSDTLGSEFSLLRLYLG